MTDAPKIRAHDDTQAVCQCGEVVYLDGPKCVCGNEDYTLVPVRIIEDTPENTEAILNKTLDSYPIDDFDDGFNAGVRATLRVIGLTGVQE